MPVSLSRFSRELTGESAFSVLVAAKRQQAAGREIVELEIGDSPFASPDVAKEAAIKAIQNDQTRYCPSAGIPEFRDAAAVAVQNEFGIAAKRENIIAAPGAKPIEQFFCEAFLSPDDGVLVFSPHFPTYPANIARRGARCVFSPLSQEEEFRPTAAAVERFLQDDPAPKAIFLNFPHNPTGGIAHQQDLAQIADLIRGRDIAVFSDEPYCHMVWKGRHHSILAEEGMMEQCVAAYTFSKSYSMSGWRLGFAVCGEEIAERIAVMINTSLSCVPPFVQLAGCAALENASGPRDADMRQFQQKVERLVSGLKDIDGFQTLPPTSTFYAFPRVADICNREGITSHGLAMYLLEGADDNFGVACLGGECFGAAGGGFLRFSCAQSDDRIDAAVAFLPEAITRTNRLAAYLNQYPRYRLSTPYT